MNYSRDLQEIRLSAERREVDREMCYVQALMEVEDSIRDAKISMTGYECPIIVYAAFLGARSRLVELTDILSEDDVIDQGKDLSECEAIFMTQLREGTYMSSYIRAIKG